MKELIVYPTLYLVKQHRMKQLEDKIGVTGEYPVTYEIFIEKCIEDVSVSKVFLGDFKKNLLINRIFQKLKKQNRLKYFDTIRQGYIYRIGEVIGELKRQDIDAKTFKSIVCEKPSHHDIALIYLTYQEFLTKNRLYDQEDRYIICKENIFKSEFMKCWDTVHFKDFFDLTPIQQKILFALGDKARITNSDVTSKMQEITGIKAQNRRTEVYKLAHVILEDINKEGLSPENICIVLRNQDAYKPLLHDIFKEADIPLHMEKKVSLVQNPFIKALLRLFQGEFNDYFSEKLSDEIFKSHNRNECINILIDFLINQGYPEKFCDIHDNDLSLVKRDLEALDSLKGLLTELHDMDRIISEEVTDMTDFAHLLESYIHSRSYNYSSTTDGIWVIPPAMLRGLSFDKIYVPGMVEGEFPRDFRPDWLLKDWERAKINEKGYCFDTLDTLLEKEGESFGFLMACSTKGYFSYPMVMEDNTSSIVSSYLEELFDQFCCPVETVSFDSVYYREPIDNFTPDPGVISGKTRDRLKKLFSKKPFSTTAFNMYGECPYKFFLARVLNLISPEEEGEYTALARGTILHKILEIFFRNHREGLYPEKKDEYRIELKNLADQIMGACGIKDSFPHPLLFEIEQNEIVNNIMNYVTGHIAQKGDFKPIFLEFGFGYKKGFSLNFAPDILLTGKIDRIDEDTEGRLVVFDYKSGSTPDIKQVEEGTNLQLPLYIMAVEQLIKKSVVGGAFISLKKGSVDNILVRDKNLPFISKRRRKGILNQKEWADMMETVKNTVRTYADSIRESQFPLQPKKCPKAGMYGSYCDFTDVCPWEGEK